jgi:hypothetical protein
MTYPLSILICSRKLNTKERSAYGWNFKVPNRANAFVVTWQISFDKVRLQNHSAAALLSRMSILDRQGIPRFLICQDDADDLDSEALSERSSDSRS